jgi:hypothetical protein
MEKLSVSLTLAAHRRSPHPHRPRPHHAACRASRGRSTGPSNQCDRSRRRPACRRHLDWPHARRPDHHRLHDHRLTGRHPARHRRPHRPDGHRHRADQRHRLQLHRRRHQSRRPQSTVGPLSPCHPRPARHHHPHPGRQPDQHPLRRHRPGVRPPPAGGHRAGHRWRDALPRAAPQGRNQLDRARYGDDHQRRHRQPHPRQSLPRPTPSTGYATRPRRSLPPAPARPLWCGSACA